MRVEALDPDERLEDVGEQGPAADRDQAFVADPGLGGERVEAAVALGGEDDGGESIWLGLAVTPRLLQQAVAAQALVEDGLDQLRLGEAGADRRAAEHLLRPEIGLEVDLEELDGAGVAVEPELEAAIIERPIFLGHPLACSRRSAAPIRHRRTSTSWYFWARSTRSRFS